LRGYAAEVQKLVDFDMLVFTGWIVSSAVSAIVSWREFVTILMSGGRE